MKPGKLVIALGAAFLLMGAQAAPHAQPKVNSASETLHAAAKPQPRASKSKVRAQKRPVQHDATLDYPQLG